MTPRHVVSPTNGAPSHSGRPVRSHSPGSVAPTEWRSALANLLVRDEGTPQPPRRGNGKGGSAKLPATSPRTGTGKGHPAGRGNGKGPAQSGGSTHGKGKGVGKSTSGAPRQGVVGPALTANRSTGSPAVTATAHATPALNTGVILQIIPAGAIAAFPPLPTTGSSFPPPPAPPTRTGSGAESPHNASSSEAADGTTPSGGPATRGATPSTSARNRSPGTYVPYQATQPQLRRESLPLLLMIGLFGAAVTAIVAAAGYRGRRARG
jgi:hypothetical protein